MDKRGSKGRRGETEGRKGERSIKGDEGQAGNEGGGEKCRKGEKKGMDGRKKNCYTLKTHSSYLVFLAPARCSAGAIPACRLSLVFCHARHATVVRCSSSCLERPADCRQSISMATPANGHRERAIWWIGRQYPSASAADGVVARETKV